MAGEPLLKVIASLKVMRPVNTNNNDATGKLWIQLHCQAVENLIGNGNTDACTLSGTYLSDTDSAEAILQSSSELRYVYYVIKLILAVIHQQKYLAADIISKKLPKVMSVFPVTLYHVMVTFYGALAIIDKECQKTEEDVEMLNQFCRDLEDWSKTNSSMFLHKYLLVHAEMNKNEFNSIMTLDIYEEAIDCALREGMVQDAALINERCGDYLQKHSKRRSQVYLREALRLYTLWGARKRASQLLARNSELSSMNGSSIDLNTSLVSDMGRSLQQLNFSNNTNSNSGTNLASATTTSSPLRWILSNLFREDGEDSNNNNNSTKPQSKNQKQSPLAAHDPNLSNMIDSQSSEEMVTENSSSSNTSRHSEAADDLELKTALQYCLDISEAIEIHSVIEKFVNSVMKSSGADYCVFVSLDQTDDQAYIDAIGILNGIKHFNHEPVNSRSDVVPVSLINHVVASGQLVSKCGTSQDLHNFDFLYGRDIYFQNRHFQSSILCMPIQTQFKTVGALYIEHQSLPNMFTVPRIELLGLLCTQVVVSLEKARMYHQMDLAKKAAEEATAEKASFLANMSHEIRTPFNALLSCSIFLLDTELSEVQREYVDIIKSSAMLTLNIIDAILAFSKIEHGSITLENCPFSLRECVESAIQLVAEPAASKDLELVHLNKCKEDIDIVYGDVTRVRQIIINLVGNSVKFTSKGFIVVETYAEKVSPDDRYEFVISVRDTGIGIPNSAKNKIFRAFSQVDGSSRRVYGGSGLGLAISKKLAELMGGSLSFESDSKGTTFWFDFVASVKVKSNEGEEKLRLENNQNIGKGSRILIIDIFEKSRESLTDELKRFGFDVSSCDKIDIELIRKMQQQNKQELATAFKGVFIEGRLLCEEDCSVVKTIKSILPRCKVIYMTTFGKRIPTDSQEKGIDAIFMRPTQRNKLIGIVEYIVNGDKASSTTNKRYIGNGHEDGHEQGRENMNAFNSISNSNSTTTNNKMEGNDNDNNNNNDGNDDDEKNKNRFKDIEQCLLDGRDSQNNICSSSSSTSLSALGTLSKRHPLKILLAEDNPINTRVALQHLRRMGYAADHAKDGVEVLSKCRVAFESGEGMYDCILMDIQMPNKDGIAAAQEIIEEYSVEDRPSIIALTANAAGEDRARCLSVGMSNYIAKPILPADLASVLMRVIPIDKRQ